MESWSKAVGGSQIIGWPDHSHKNMNKAMYLKRNTSVLIEKRLSYVVVPGKLLQLEVPRSSLSRNRIGKVKNYRLVLEKILAIINQLSHN